MEFGATSEFSLSSKHLISDFSVDTTKESKALTALQQTLVGTPHDNSEENIFFKNIIEVSSKRKNENYYTKCVNQRLTKLNFKSEAQANIFMESDKEVDLYLTFQDQNSDDYNLIVEFKKGPISKLEEAISESIKYFLHLYGPDLHEQNPHCGFVMAAVLHPVNLTFSFKILQVYIKESFSLAIQNTRLVKDDYKFFQDYDQLFYSSGGDPRIKGHVFWRKDNNNYGGVKMVEVSYREIFSTEGESWSQFVGRLGQINTFIQNTSIADISSVDYYSDNRVTPISELSLRDKTFSLEQFVKVVQQLIDLQSRGKMHPAVVPGNLYFEEENEYFYLKDQNDEYYPNLPPSNNKGFDCLLLIIKEGLSDDDKDDDFVKRTLNTITSLQDLENKLSGELAKIEYTFFPANYLNVGAMMTPEALEKFEALDFKALDDSLKQYILDFTIKIATRKWGKSFYDRVHTRDTEFKNLKEENERIKEETETIKEEMKSLKEQMNSRKRKKSPLSFPQKLKRLLTTLFYNQTK